MCTKCARHVVSYWVSTVWRHDTANILHGDVHVKALYKRQWKWSGVWSQPILHGQLRMAGDTKDSIVGPHWAVVSWEVNEEAVNTARKAISAHMSKRANVNRWKLQIYAILIVIRLDELPRGDKKKARGANASRPKCAPDGVLQLTQYNEESGGKQICTQRTKEERAI